MNRTRIPTPSPPKLLLRLYALALWIYPRRQRRRFGAQMLLMVEEGWRARRLTGRVSAWAFWGNAFRDLLANALLARMPGDIREARPRPAGARRHHPAENRSPLTRIEVLLGNTAQDIKYALRMIARAPGFSAAVVLTLTLGIGANAAIFSVLNGVVLQPMPYPAADRLVHVWTRFPEQDIDQFQVSRAEFHDYRIESELFEEMFAYNVQNLTLTGVGAPARTRAVFASAGIWKVLGGNAAHGRLFGPEEDRPGNEQVVVLDHAFWQQTFGGDPSIVGQTIRLNGFSFEVIGIVEPGFAPPDDTADLYRPLAVGPDDLEERSGHGLIVLGRTRPGVSLDDVLAEMSVVSARWEEQYDHAHPFTANRLADQVIGDARRPLFLLAGAVGFVLLIACANVAALLMARTTGRQREIAVRAALGAPRLRLVRQILTEGIVLAAAGGALGFALAAWGTGALLQLEPGDLPRLGEISTDATVAAFVVVLSLAAGLLFAAVPAWRATSSTATVAGVAGSRSTSDRAKRSFQRSMVAGEVAVAIVLVIGSGLLLRSFAEITRVDPGLEADNLVATRISLPFGSYDEVEKAQAFWDRLQGELEALPGVQGIAIVRSLPLRDVTFMERFLREGETEAAATASGHVPSFDWQTAAPGYFRALGIPLLSGRGFNEFDRPGSPRVAIVSESLADRYFSGRSPVGERIRILATEPDDVPFEIVGVAADVRHDGLAADAPIQIYTPFAQNADYRPGLLWTAAVALRTELDTDAAAGALRDAVWSIDAELPLARVSTMEQVLHEAVARPRFIALLLSLLSALALALACIGVYGVVAYGVTQRTREMGIRIALGARPREILSLVMREGLTPALIGIAAGLIGALFATRLAESLLFGVTATDPATYAVVTAVLGLAALLAAWVPGRRATRVDALESLRAE